MNKVSKVQSNKKKRLIILIIGIALIGIMVGGVLIRNVVVNKETEGGKYLAGENANSSLIANNIKKGITIGGITGTLESLDTSDATATPEDILEGKTAYVNGVKITGTYGRKPSNIEEAMGSDYIFEETTTIEDDNGKEVTIPKDFGVAEDSNTVVDDGIVITDGTNEFVWVPVDDPSTMFEEKTATLTGVTTQTSIYSKLRVRSGDSYTSGAPGTTGIREPDVLTSYDTNPQYYQNILGFESTKSMADSMVAEYKAMSVSVKKYHGFWIGRYELTGTVDTPTVKAGDVLTASSSEAGNWYGLYKACQNVIKNNTDVKSTMIYGCQWDETMSWLSRNGYNTDTDSSSWGNYNNSQINTGSDTRYKANEIFDLAGNYYDWTQEAYSTGYRVVRGGDSYGSGSSYPAAARGNGSASNSVSNVSSRAVLYIL